MRPSLLRAAAAAIAVALCVGVPASAPAAGSGAANSRVGAPVEPLRVVRLFERPPAPWAAGHRGVDLAASRGQRVVAPAAGVVTFAGTVVDRGVVTMALDGGLVVSVEPVAAEVEAGQRVRAGEALGVVGTGASHCEPAACVHWGVRRDGEYLNPLDVLAGFGTVRLLPLEG